MTEFRTFQPGEILSKEEQAKLSPEDRKRYKVEQRIRAAMALANNSVATEDERAQATRTIAKLITLHQIDVDALMDKDDAKGPVKIVHFNFEVSNRYGLGGLRACAIDRAVVTPLGGTVVYWHSASEPTSMPTKCQIFLPEDMVSFAKILMASLLLQVETSMKVASVHHQRELKLQMSSRHIPKMLAQFRKGYLLSWSATVGRRMDQGREDARQEASEGTGKEVVLRNTRTLAEEARNVLYKKITKARTVRVSETGQTAGRKDGMRANIGNNQLTSA